MLTAPLVALAAPAEAKVYKGAEVYSLQSVLYGRMEMRMRMIRGSSLVSTFFTYKNGSEASGAAWEELDVEALGKNDGKSWQSNLITGNPRMTSEQLYTSPTSLADHYHTYTLEWTPDYVSWTFDGVVVRKTQGGQANSLTNPESLRFNAWASDAVGWAGAFDEAALPAYQFVNWIKYYRYDSGQFVLDWMDDFDSFDSTRWGTGNWTFDGNLLDFDPANAVVQDGTLILAITKEGATGFTGTVPVDDGSTPGADGGVIISKPGSDSGCAVAGSPPRGGFGLCAVLLGFGLAAGRGRRRRPIGEIPRPFAASKTLLTLAALVFGVLAPRVASAIQGAELYRSQSYFYGRFEARVQYAPGEGVVSSFFLWKDGSSATTSWNELDFEKINATCRMQTNIWSGKGTQSAVTTTPADICTGYHTYTMEWTPDYIAWFIDGVQLRRVTGALVTEYTQNASAGMNIHFNIWQGDSSFGGTLNAATLPVRQYISWVSYSSYANGAFQMQWREDFNGSTVPSGWATGNWLAPLNHSMHNQANVSFVNGIAVLSMTADNATGYTGTPPADPAGGGAGTSGTAGTVGTGGRGGGGGGTGGTGTAVAGRGGAGGAVTGSGGRGGVAGSASPGSAGTSSTGSAGTGGATSAGAAGNGAIGAAGTTADGGTSGGIAGTGVGTGGTSSSMGSAGTTGAGGTSSSVGAGGAGGPADSGSSGCSCELGSSSGGPGGLVGLLLSLFVVAASRPRVVERLRRAAGRRDRRQRRSVRTWEASPRTSSTRRASCSME